MNNNFPMVRQIEKANPIIVFILFFVISIGFLHYLSFNKMPTRIHAWAQSDHYALALGFIDNNFDFFHPQTFALSLQFPAHEELNEAKGITAVDFPILHYIVAVSMNVLGTTKPWVFRIVSLLISFLGLLTLYRILYKIKGLWIALFVVSFIIFQPIYSYYQNGFHVSAAAFNIQVIGIALFFKYWHYRTNKYFYWGVVFLTLAALLRFTQVITLLAVFSSLSWASYRKRQFEKRLIPVTIGLLIIGAYFIYNKILTFKYGSVFQGSPLPAESFSALLIHLFRIGKGYLRGFLPFTHLFGLIVVIVLANRQKAKGGGDWESWLFFSVIGTVMFTLLMSWHLSAHDYYSLDTWLPPLTIGLLYCVYTIDFSKYNKTVVMLLVSLFIVGTFSVALEHQVRKYSDKQEVSGVDLVIKDFSNSSEFLDNVVSHDAKVLIISGAGWNSPMMGWRRPAYRVAWKFNEQIEEELKKDYDFIVTHNAYFEGVLNSYPEFNEKVNLLTSNGLVSIWGFDGIVK
ncbi:ArnT family glycosyltransferase [Carboxylicivirga marina]|uniref:Glycosyltransferase family 39 protein n=1 Tax=Carboxylicivirga marina TaxID=2800988 RepID=A0ABS1HE59_9BACT|nr:glycosyltransferase family 39 protein [Carboxylicivirga marina]MBK3515957.1 glycosyltransferase family 39 protein [Carboxylicivirga marina]